MDKENKKKDRKDKVDISEAMIMLGKMTAEAAEKSKKAVGKASDVIVEAIDQNHNGEVDIEDVIILGFKTPGIKVSRSSFLRREFLKYYPQEVIDDAVLYNPAHAGIPLEDIDKIADQVIQFERNCVSGISAALGAPGGLAIAATASADIIQYYGYMFRATQKLLYLYGFPELDLSGEGQGLDSGTMNTLIICMGVMYGVAGANGAIKAMGQALAQGVEKKLLNAALTKGAVFPIVKNIMKWFNVNLTKAVFSKTVTKAIPVVGGVLGGAITYVSFKPCCDRLKAGLRDTMLTKAPERQTSGISEIIDITDISGSEE